MKKKVFTADELVASAWCAALASTCAPTDVVPPGWFTNEALSLKLKMSLTTLKNRMSYLLGAGKAERKMFRIQLAKHTRPVPHYRLLK